MVIKYDFPEAVIRDFGQDGYTLLAHFCVHDIVNPLPPMPDMFYTYLTRLRKGEPISKILGEKGFWKHVFYTHYDVLDPRPETELLLEKALQVKKTGEVTRILDLGTGSGCILLSALYEYPNAVGVGVDISPKALHIAKKNAQKLHMEERVQFVLDDWGKHVQGQFDVIFSNPPYICTGDTIHPNTQYDPDIALFAGVDGLVAYREILPQIVRLLSPRGYALLEISSVIVKDLIDITNNFPIIISEVCKDLQTEDRCILIKNEKN